MDSYCIKICVGPQGITVAVEPETDAETTGTPVKSIDEALQRVQAIYSQQGQNPEAADAQGDTDFTSGFA